MVYSSIQRKKAILSLIPENTSILRAQEQEQEIKPMAEPAIIEEPEMVEEEEFKEPVQTEPIDTKTIHTNYTFINRETGNTEHYAYLNDERLPQIFEFVKENNDVAEENIGISEPNLTYRIYLGLFRFIVKDTPYPYLLFSLASSSQQSDIPTSLNFHQFDYTPTIPNMENGISKETDEMPTHTEFLNKCLQQIANIYPQMVEHVGEQGMEDIYKGFVSNERDIYVFFDISKIVDSKEEGIAEYVGGDETITIDNSNPVDSSHFIWSCLEEIILYKASHGLAVDSGLSALFVRYPELYTIRNHYGNAIPIPHLLYLCENHSGFDEGTISNVLIPKDGIYTSLTPITSMVHHPIFGYIYRFTYKPIAGYSPDLARYLGFVEDAIYLFKDVPSVNPNEIIAPFEEIEGLEDSSCIYYKENGTVFWAFRYPDRFVSLQ